jgi:hypothetical protein
MKRKPPSDDDVRAADELKRLQVDQRQRLVAWTEIRDNRHAPGSPTRNGEPSNRPETSRGP